MIEQDIKNMLEYDKNTGYTSKMIGKIINKPQKSVSKIINRYARKKKTPRIYKTKRQIRSKGMPVMIPFYHMGQRSKIKTWVWNDRQRLL